MVLEKTLESPFDCKEIHPVHPKGNQSWIFIRRTDAETEALISWPSDAKIWLIEKDPDAGKNWRQEKGMTEDEMVRWHHWLEGHEFEQALGAGNGQGSLECYSPWGCKKSDMTEQLNWTESRWKNKGFIRSQLLDGDKSIGCGVRRQHHPYTAFCSLVLLLCKVHPGTYHKYGLCFFLSLYVRLSSAKARIQIQTCWLKSQWIIFLYFCRGCEQDFPGQKMTQNMPKKRQLRGGEPARPSSPQGSLPMNHRVTGCKTDW